MRLLEVDLSSAVALGSTIITPSPLLASVASRQITEMNLKQGLDAWQRPEVFSLSAWLTNCWRTVRYSRTDVPTLLSSAQEQALWQRVIGQEHPNLFHQTGTARLAIDATRLIAEWHILLEHEAWSSYRDAQQFRELFTRFRSLCKGRDWITCSDLWRLVPDWISKGAVDPGTVVFAGFERFSPAADGIREALGHRAQTVFRSSRNLLMPAWGKSCTDFSEEVEYVARWVRRLIEENSNRSVGIFAPDLSSHYPLIERTFHQVFYPSRSRKLAEARRHDLVEQQSIFHIDGSKPLSSHPLIVNAFLLLELARPQISLPDASSILRCPFITGAAVEKNARALADRNLRRRRNLDVTLPQMKSSTENCPLLTPVWDSLYDILRRRSWTLELSQWSEFISDLLEAFGWPGDDELRGEEQEIVEIWKNALLELGSVGLVGTPVSFETAHSQLRRIVASTSSFSVGDWLSPVQILDAKDASGLQFDCSIVMGMSDDTWPMPEKSWPFVPSALRRAAQFPGSEPKTLGEERQRRTRSLFESAPTVLATCSGRWAPLARSFVENQTIEPIIWDGNLPVDSYSFAEFEVVDDTNAPPFESNEVALGGVEIIKSQSLCPFRAFAEHRLHAGSPEDAGFGIDARDRGSFLHKALELVWKKLEKLERLQNMDAGELRELVCAAIQEAIKDHHHNPFHQLLNQTERERLEALIIQWLNFERGRKIPFTVEYLEVERTVDLNGLHLKLRVDRIDRLSDGSVILIDYKSGDLKAKDLEGIRPSEPQLLTYAATLEGNVEGVYIAKPRPRQPDSVGFAYQEHFPASKQSRKKTPWEQIRDESRHYLYSIAAEFVAGYAPVKPEKGACTYCDLAALCRIGEKAKVDDDEDSSD